MTTLDPGMLRDPKAALTPHATARAPWYAPFRHLLEDLLAMPRAELTLRLSLLLLIFYGSTGWALEIPIKILCGMMLLSTRLMMSVIPWILVTLAAVSVHAMSWYTIDNHKYLITYWCMVCTLAVATSNPDRVLSFNGRWLIGLVFAFAMYWKFAAGEYLDGSFLHHTFLQDRRLEAVTRVIAGMGHEVMPMNYKLADLVRTFPHHSPEVVLNTSETLRAVTLGASYWTLLIEGAVAVAFLAPVSWAIHRFRDALLMIFVATTYFLLPVMGFAFMLSLMGIAQCETHRSRTRMLYLFLFIFIQLTKIPWKDYLTFFTIPSFT